MPLVGFICSIIAYKKAEYNSEAILSFFGWAISGLAMVASVIATLYFTGLLDIILSW